ncbi:MAG: hypothetical protein HPZ91_06270 [Lentisphaeria bacterium]|nr:hypothetical protein [Lentisphaeria bacterium]
MAIRVFNAGIPGDTTRELLARFNRDVAARAPELVILWAGVNDRLYPGHTVEPPELEENYRELLDRIEAIGAKVLVGTLPPQYRPYLFEQFPAIAEFPELPEARLAPVNAFLRGLGLPLADFEAVVKSRPVGEVPESFLQNRANSGLRDGLHLTPEGAEAVARCAAGAIREHALPTGRIVCFGDSLTYGYGLRREATYPFRLAELLQ